MEKQKLGKGWFLSLFGGIVFGAALAVGTLLLFSYTMYNTYNKEYAVQGADKSLKAESQVLLDNEEMKVTFKGFDQSVKKGEDLVLEVENKTDRAKQVMCDTVEVNGYAVQNALHDKIESNSSRKVGLSITSELNKMGIDKITDIKFSLLTSDSDDFDHVVEGPFEIKTNHYGSFKQEEKDATLAKELLYDENGVKIYAVETALPDARTVSPEFWFIIENDTDRKIRVGENKVVANGITMDTVSFYPTALYPGQKTKEAMALLISDAEEKNVGEDIRTLDAQFSIDFEIEQENGKISKHSEHFETPLLKVK